MGVHGLWQLLQAAGQPVTLESLEGKILAVDVSIWLHQTMKGMRGKDGDPVPNAHLQGLFSRICKLLFYRIRPVFVFDGGVPVLKKKTMAARRERKAEAERESNEISQKLLENLIKSQAVRQTIGGREGSSKHVPKGRRGQGQADSDMFQLPPLAESDEIGLAINAEEWEKDFERQEQWIRDGLAAISDTHPDSEEFKSLPNEIQHEILNELRQQKKYHSLSTITNMPEDSTDFSSYQLKKLMKQSKLTNRIEEVRKNMASKTSGDIACDLGEEYRGEEVEARRIVSEDAAHYILIKGLTKRMQQAEADKYEIHNRVKLEDEDVYLVEDGASSGWARVKDGSNAGWARVKDEPQSEEETALGSEVKAQCSESDSDGGSALARRLNRKRHQKGTKSSRSVKDAKKSKVAPISRKSRAKQIVSDDDDGVDLPGEHRDVADCSSEDEGFIEIRVDPSVAAEDDLFPASIFQTSFGMDAGVEGRNNTVCQQTTGHKGSNTDQIKDDLTRGKLNISSEMQQTTITAHPNTDSEDTEVCRSKLWNDTVSNPVSLVVDIATKRQNVLNEILSQLEEKKKRLSDLQADLHVETSIDGGFMQADVAADPSTDGGFVQADVATDRSTDGGFVQADVATDRSTDGGFAQADVAADPSTDGGFMQADVAADPSTDGGFLQADSSIDGGQEDLSQGLDETSMMTKENEEPSSSMISVTDEASFLSESDEDLKIAIELSLQTARSKERRFTKVSTISRTELKEDTLSADGVKRKSTEAGKILPRAQEANERSKDLHSAYNDSDNLQEDTEHGSPDDSLECDARFSLSEHSETPASRSRPSLTDEARAEKKLSPEAQLGSDGIDFERTYRYMNEGELQDVRTNLETERSALLSERGRQTRMAASITDQTNEEAQELLRLFGIPFIISPMEAEAQCAHLNLTRQIQGTVTDDSDIWLFGGSHVYKNFFNQSKHVELYTYDNICNHFGLSRQQLINIALLCGSDYTEGIPGVGPVRALEIMAEFPGDGLKGLQDFRKWWNKAKSQPAFVHESKVRARLRDLKVIPGFPSQAVVDAYLNPQVDDSSERFAWGTPDLDMLREFAKYKFGWSREKADQSLLPMMKQLNKRESQSRIHSFFQPEHFVKNSKIKSQRLKNALAIVRNPKQATQQEDCAVASAHNNSVVKDRLLDTNRKEMIVKRAGNNVADASSSSQGKSTAPAKKKVGKSSKKTMRTLKRKTNVELTEGEIEQDKVEELGREVNTGNKEREEVQESEKRKFETEKIVKVNKDKVRKGALKKSQKKVSFTGIKKGENESLIKIEGDRDEYLRQENDIRDEDDFVCKENQSQQEVSERPRVVPSLDKCRTKRGGKTATMRGRGNILLSLDHKQRSRGRNFGSRKGGMKIERGALNLSSSSDSSDDTDGSDPKEQTKGRKIRSHAGQVERRQNSKHNLSTGMHKAGESQVQRVSESKHQHTKTVKEGRRLQNTSTVEPDGRKASVQLATGKKIYKEKICTESEAPKSLSTELTKSEQDGVTNQDNMDMKKADVSVINKQNLLSTLTYLNRRSKEDQLLLQRLKDSKGFNVVEKRLQEGEKRSKQEKERLEGSTQPAGEARSFGDMLGSVDSAVTKSCHNKVQTPETHKKTHRLDDRQKDSNNKTKIFQDRILHQIGQFSTGLVGTSSKGESDASLRQPSLKADESIHRSSSLQYHTLQDDDDEKIMFANNVNKNSVNDDLPKQKELDEKSVFSMPVRDKKAVKSNRSRAFDKPIDNMSDCSSDVLSDGGSGKLSKKRKFLKQMEHLGDSRSVRGHGLLPRQQAGGGGGGQAFVGKGKGRGKNRNYRMEVSGDRLGSENVSQQEILEYASVTADDLGSDFSDCEV